MGFCPYLKPKPVLDMCSRAGFLHFLGLGGHLVVSYESFTLSDNAVFYSYEPHDQSTIMISISDPNMEYAHSPFCSAENGNKG